MFSRPSSAYTSPSVRRLPSMRVDDPMLLDGCDAPQGTQGAQSHSIVFSTCKYLKAIVSGRAGFAVRDTVENFRLRAIGR